MVTHIFSILECHLKLVISLIFAKNSIIWPCLTITKTKGKFKNLFDQFLAWGIFFKENVEKQIHLTRYAFLKPPQKSQKQL